MNTTNQHLSAFEIITGVFTEPTRAFAEIRERGLSWIPLLAVIATSIILYIWYFQAVDFSWLVDQGAAAMKTPEQQEAYRKFTTLSMMQTMSVVGVLIGTPLVTAVMALYFLIVAKFAKHDIGFKSWFALVAWSNLPTVLLLVLGAVQILLASNGQLTLEELNPLTINNLITHFPAGTGQAKLAEAFSFLFIWNWFLQIVAYRDWTKSSTLKSILVVIAPSVVIFAVMAFFFLK